MWLDVVFLFVAGLAFLRGYRAGILRAVVWIVGVSIALLVTMRYAGVTTRALERLLDSDAPLLYLVGFLLTFIVVIALVRWMGLMVEHVLGFFKMGFLNRTAGGILSAVLATLLLAVVLGALDRMQWLPPETKAASGTWPVLVTVPDQAAMAYRDLQPRMADLFDHARHNLEEAHSQGRDQ